MLQVVPQPLLSVSPLLGVGRRMVSQPATDVAAATSFAGVPTPILMSFLAGAATSVGASIVFCAARNGGGGKRESANGKQQQQQQSPLSDAHMSFSLALATSVMLTVSFYSLLPESFTDESSEYLPVRSRLFWERSSYFAIGVTLYWVLSKFAFPEPDAILGFDEEDRGSSADPELAIATPHEVSVDEKTRAKKTTLAKRQSSIGPERLRSRNASVVESDSNLSDSVSAADFNPESESLLNSNTEISKVGYWSQFASGRDLSTNEARRAWVRTV